MNASEHPFLPENHPQFNYGDEVDIALHGDVTKILKGKILGYSIKNIIDYWIVECEDIMSDVYPYKVFTCPHQFLRKSGENTPFGCEFKWSE